MHGSISVGASCPTAQCKNNAQLSATFSHAEMIRIPSDMATAPISLLDTLQ